MYLFNYNDFSNFNFQVFFLNLYKVSYKNLLLRCLFISEFRNTNTDIVFIHGLGSTRINTDFSR